MRPMFHVFFVLLLLQDAFSLNVEFTDKNHSYFVLSKKKDGNTNCSAGNNSPKDLFKYFSCFLQNIFSKKLITQAEQEALDYKNKEVKNVKKKLTKAVRTESGKLKKLTEKQFDYWDKFLEKSVSEQIYKTDGFSKDQINLLKQKGEPLLFTNIFSFSKNEKGENPKMGIGGTDEEKEKEKNTETSGRGFWPFSSKSSFDGAVKEEEFPVKEKQVSFLSFFNKEEMEKKSPEAQETQETQTQTQTQKLTQEKKKEQEGHSSWWFSKTNEEDKKTNELKNPPISEENENRNKKSFFNFLKSSKTNEDISEQEKTNEEEPSKRKWYNIFSKESTDKKTDISERNKEDEQEQQSWWSRNYGKNKNKVDGIEAKGQHEEMNKHIQTEHKGHWWNFTNVFSKEDKNDNEISDEMNKAKEAEIEKEKQESDSLFKLWGYNSPKDTATPGEEEIENVNTRTDHNTNEDKEPRRESIIFDIASHGDANELKDTVQEEPKEEQEETHKETQEQKKTEMKMEETGETDDEEKSKEGGISSLFHFNKTPKEETPDIFKEKLEEPTSKEDTSVNFFEKIYNYNLEDIHDEQFLSLLNTEHEGDPNVNCHPLIVFKVCVYKCFKALDSQHNKEGTSTQDTTGSGINEVGLTNNDYKQLEKCILKCKKMSFDYVHGGCVQPNGKVLNKKENYKDYMEELETYNLKLTDHPNTFSDFSLEDKYVDKKKQKGGKHVKNEKQVKNGTLQTKLQKAINGDVKGYAHDIWNMAKEEIKLQMFHKNDDGMQPILKKNWDKANKTNEVNSNIQNVTYANSNEDKNKKSFYAKSKEFFNTFTKKEKENNELEQTEEKESTMEGEKIEFLNHDAYTISDDVIHNEIYARSNSYMSTIFFLILIVLSLCIYFSVFTSIISQFFFNCTEEIASFMRGSYKATFVNIPDSPTEYFLSNNEKNKNYSAVENEEEDEIGNKKRFYVTTNEPVPTKDGNILGANRYPPQQFSLDHV